jgi:hypothetical protein
MVFLKEMREVKFDSGGRIGACASFADTTVRCASYIIV